MSPNGDCTGNEEDDAWPLGLAGGASWLACGKNGGGARMSPPCPPWPGCCCACAIGAAGLMWKLIGSNMSIDIWLFARGPGAIVGMPHCGCELIVISPGPDDIRPDPDDNSPGSDDMCPGPDDMGGGP